MLTFVKIPNMSLPSQPHNPQPNQQLVFAQKLDAYEVLDPGLTKAFDTFASLLLAQFACTASYVVFFQGERILLRTRNGEVETNEMEELKMLVSDPESVIFHHADDFYLAYPLVSPEGIVVGFLGVKDFNPIPFSENSLHSLKLISSLLIDSLEQALAVRETIRIYDDRLRVLVHDLKNPMTSILLQSELLNKLGNSDKTPMIADKIHVSAKRMIDNLNLLLSAARVEHEVIKLQKATVNIQETLHAVIDYFSPILNKKDLTVAIQADGDLSIQADADKLFLAFKNVMNNAIKFSAPHKTIHLGIQQEDSSLTIAVRDEGEGIRQEDLSKIFTKFSSISNPHQETGTRLGLFIANMIVDMHKGSISAKSDGLGTGATFYITLPSI
ncbi:sensor histidine kinase [Pedobacter sp. MW01-1-1]|uniref:sensor histidine kinase n=1 Tax=Pedobacter sp. MW01-1-1 TaxID=3383027 RepID=UPI003FEEA98D